MQRLRDVTDLPVGDDVPLALTEMVGYDVPVPSTAGVGVELALNRRPTPAEVACDREGVLALGSATVTHVVQVGEIGAGVAALNEHLGRVSQAARILGDVSTAPVAADASGTG